MKKIRYMRHGDKNGQNISAAGLQQAGKQVDLTNVTDLFYSDWARTAQTLLAALASHCHKQRTGYEIRVHEAVAELGNEEMFKTLSTPAWKNAAAQGHDGLATFMIAFETEEERKPIRDWAISGLIKMFAQMPDDGYGLAIGHDPIISLCAMACDATGRSLQPLEYVDFIQDDEGNIRAVIASD